MVKIMYHLNDISRYEVVEPQWLGSRQVVVPTEKQVLWSGSKLVPALGEHVKLNTEFAGGVITGYFIEYDWLGFYFEPDVRPAWWVRQQNTKPPHQGHAMGFGCDII